MTFVHNANECLNLIKEELDKKDKTISYLREENAKLKDKAYKDSELKEMKEKLDEMQKDYWRGFPISAKEEAIIEEWMKKHDEESHDLNTLDKKLEAGGAIGGRYSYHFVPTSIGVIGTVKCNCGAEFTFQNI